MSSRMSSRSGLRRSLRRLLLRPDPQRAVIPYVLCQCSRRPTEEPPERLVLRVIDTHAKADEGTTAVEVVDTTPPEISCNSPATIVPPGSAVTLTASAGDVRDAAVTPVLSAPRCFKINGSGAVVTLPASACKTTVSGNQATIAVSGGVGTHVVWTATATDDAGNVSTRDCEVVVVKP